eukprot:6214260-Pleurochrysis_carterae.AAC.7
MACIASSEELYARINISTHGEELVICSSFPIVLNGRPLIFSGINLTLVAESHNSTIDASGLSRVMCVMANAHVRLERIRLQAGTGTEHTFATARASRSVGGGLLISGSSSVELSHGSSVTRCTAEYGAGAWCESNSQLILIDSSVTDCVATRRGGAAGSVQASITLTRSYISGCSAFSEGALVLYLSRFAAIETSFRECHAEHCNGAVGGVQDCELMLLGCQLRNCTAQTDNGAIGVSDGSVAEMVNCSLQHLFADIGGGALGVEQGSRLKLLNCFVESCQSTDRGGAVQVLGGVVHLVETVVRRCSSNTFGGFLYSRQGAVSMLR